jgi:biotin operon repressor
MPVKKSDARRSANPRASNAKAATNCLYHLISKRILTMPVHQGNPKKGSISSGNNRSIPLDTETARQLGGGARGRTIALIYRQLSYWSKYAKWTGKNGKKFFYKSQKELSEELCMSEKTINRAIKALRELGLVIVEKLHKRYWRQVNFYYLPHSPFAAAAPEASTEPAAAEATSAPTSTSSSSRTTSSIKTTKPASAGSVDASGAAAATAASIRSRGSRGFGQNVRIQQKKDNPFIKQSLQSVVERCLAMGERMKKEQGMDICNTAT